MFSLQWNIENLLAPLVVMLIGEILKWFFVQITEYIKKPHFFVDNRCSCSYDNQARNSGN